ncbi:MAG TPA: cyclic nucleotide-binding domain-containing protein [Burkholderiales bacterium]|nr:cyclic nucleotide-binding domain-containing protein [Burkholderiales bacterium]
MATVDLFRAEDTELVSFRAGEDIFREGDPGDVMYVVHDGQVDLRVKGQLVDALGPGGVLGEMALIEHAPRTATASANTDCTLVPITEKRFMFMVQQTPHFALQIMKVMAERLRRMDARL